MSHEKREKVICKSRDREKVAETGNLPDYPGAMTVL